VPNLVPSRRGMRRAPRRGGGIGIRSGLKIRRPQGLVGSTPTPGTNDADGSRSVSALTEEPSRLFAKDRHSGHHEVPRVIVNEDEVDS
jgi:hypothetical protein